MNASTSSIPNLKYLKRSNFQEITNTQKLLGDGLPPPLRVQIQNPFYLMFLPRKYFCKTKTLVLVKKAKNPNSFLLLAVTKMQQIQKNSSRYIKYRHLLLNMYLYFLPGVIQWKLCLTKYYNQLYVKPVLLDIITKPEFQHCQAKKSHPVFTIHVCLYLSLLQMEPPGIPPEKNRS